MKIKISVSKDKPQPLYIQIKDCLVKMIENGELILNDKLPSDRELSQELNVSRMTARKGLVELANLGLTYASPGKGTFVAKTKIFQDLQLLTSFTDDMKSRGIVTVAKILESKIIPAPLHIAEILNINPGSEIVLLDRIRFGGDEPIALVKEYLPNSLCKDIHKLNFENRSLYETLREEYGLRLTKGKQSISVDIANEIESNLLEYPRNFPVMRIKRIAFSENNQVVSYAEATYRGDKYEFNVVLTANFAQMKGEF